MRSLHGEESPQPLGPALWNWENVKRVLVVRLRSIGDTVLATPSLFALKRFLPHASIDILVEDWVAPVLEKHPHVDNILTISKGSTASRARMVRQLRANRYDVVYNLHGGTTATFLSRATGAKHRVGYASYQYSRLHNHVAPSPLSDLVTRQASFGRAATRFVGLDRCPGYGPPSYAVSRERRSCNHNCSAPWRCRFGPNSFCGDSSRCGVCNQAMGGWKLCQNRGRAWRVLSCQLLLSLPKKKPV